jgi:hypothetical protein
MPITLNGTTGVVTPGATVGSITGILKATSGIVAQAVAGSDYGQLTLATEQAASGTAVDFTGIPSWVKRITIMFAGVSLSGASSFLIQVGTSSGIVSTGYSGGGTRYGGAVIASASGTNGISPWNITASAAYSGLAIWTLVGGNIWTCSLNFGASGGIESGGIAGGSLTLSGTLDRVRITTVNGTDTFDAGTINISYE